jgi:hypothetical protein
MTQIIRPEYFGNVSDPSDQLTAFKWQLEIAFHLVGEQVQPTAGTALGEDGVLRPPL